MNRCQQQQRQARVHTTAATHNCTHTSSATEGTSKHSLGNAVMVRSMVHSDKRPSSSRMLSIPAVQRLALILSFWIVIYAFREYVRFRMCVCLGVSAYGEFSAEVAPTAFEKRLADVIFRNGGLQSRMGHMKRAKRMHMKCFPSFRKQGCDALISRCAYRS